jgi:hypothetical protein
MPLGSWERVKKGWAAMAGIEGRMFGSVWSIHRIRSFAASLIGD